MIKRATILLRHMAVRSNVLVYMRDSFDEGEYYSRVVREFLDFKPYLDVQREAYKWRVTHGQA